MLRSSSKHRGDRKIVRAVRSGEESAANELVERFWPGAYRVAYLLLQERETAEEVAQDALLSAVSSIDSFETGRPFGPWLNRIAANKAYDRLRRQRRTPELVVEAVPDAAGDPDELADQVARELLPTELMSALASLPTELRVAVVLRHLLDYPPREISELIGVPAATVRTRIHRGLYRLRGALEDREGGTAHERVG